MPRNILTILFLSSILIAHSQEIPKFGKLPDSYVEMKIYPNDSSAEAVVLFDIGSLNMIYLQSEGWKMVFERHTIIKVLSKEGYEWADHEIELYDDGKAEENVTNLKGNTYNIENGKVVISKLSKTSKFSEKTNKYWKTEKFTMPDVKVGSVIEYSYKITSDFYFNLKPWSFQHKIPTMYSELTKRIPEYFNYRLLTQGYYSFFKNESSTERSKIILTGSSRGGTIVARTTFSREEVDLIINKQVLAAKDIPAMKSEAYTSSIENYRMKVQFELQGTNFPNSNYKDYRGSWGSLNKQFLENQYFGKAIKQIGSIKNEIQVINALDDDYEKIVQAKRLINSKMKWNGFNSKYAESTLNSALKKGEGNVADMNLALTGVLRELGFEATPVLSSTRSNGLVNVGFPISNQFNYVLTLVKVGDKEILIDASSNLPPGFIPQKCINGNGWAVTKEGGKWVNLLGSNASYRIAYKTDVQIDENNNIQSDVRIERIAYASFGQRYQIASKEEEERIEQLEKSYNFEIGSYNFENLNEVSKPLIETFNAKVTEKANQAGNLLLVTPLIIGKETENPFKLKQRDYPVDFTFPRYIAYQGAVTIPDGYVVDQLPEAVALALPNKKGRFLFSVQEKDGSLTVTSLMQLRKSLFLPEEYPYLKEFFSKIVEKHNENIVFKKKT